MKLDPKKNALEFHFSPNSNEFWREIGHLVADGFEANGFHVLRHETENPVGVSSRAIHVAVGGHEYFNTFRMSEEAARQTAPEMVALTGEQPGSQWFSANLPKLALCKECWDITASGTEALRGRGINARHLQLGFSKRLSAAEESLSKSLDVFFMASLTHERARRIAEFGLERWHLKSHFQLAEIAYAKTARDKIYLPNFERNRLAASSKITLNYHGHLIPFFEWHRALVAMANESLFLTDPVRGSSPLVAGRHYISASHQIINHVVDFFLDRPEMRIEITTSARDFIGKNLTMAQCVARFVEAEDYRGASYESADNQPIPKIQSDLMSYLAKVRSQSFPRLFAASCAQKSNTPPKKFNRNHFELKRREMEKRLEREARDSVSKAPYDIERFGVDPENCFPVTTSVVISLFNYENTICTALDSLLFATKDKRHLEIVVVDDGSSDDSVEAARQWMEKSPFPCVLIKKHYNTGFISSRNIGTQEASGEFIAIMDADNAFLPSGIDRLVERAKSTGADACYGIIVCVDEAGQALGLHSSQPWDVRRLLFSPYIDAMSLFKKSKMLEVGLYDVEMFKYGWFGWEDYEFWLRLAERDAKVEFVPNFVALYRSHSSSMINATNMFQKDIIEYLTKKFRSLVKSHSHADKVFGIPKSTIQGQLL